MRINKAMHGNAVRNLQNYVRMPLMTISETARYMGVGHKMVYMLIDLEEIRVARWQRTLLVEKTSVDLYMKSGRRI